MVHFLKLRQNERTNLFDQTTLLHTVLIINMIPLDELLASTHYISAALKMAIELSDTEKDSWEKKKKVLA